MRLALLIALYFAPQTAAPGQLTVSIDGVQVNGNQACSVTTPWLLSCVSQVNSIPVCPYGRVTDTALPGQPYTILTYPKKDANGNSIDIPNGGKACVSVLQQGNPADPRYWTAPFLW